MSVTQEIAGIVYSVDLVGDFVTVRAPGAVVSVFEIADNDDETLGAQLRQALKDVRASLGPTKADREDRITRILARIASKG